MQRLFRLRETMQRLRRASAARRCAAALMAVGSLWAATGRVQAANDGPTVVLNVKADPSPAAGATLPPAQQAEFVRAQKAAREILARPEFQPPEQTWWDLLKAKLYDWIARFFMNVDRATTAAPWIGRLLEVLFFGGAAVGLLVWVLRMVQRQRLRVALGAGATQAMTEWDRDPGDWQRLSEMEAAKGAWREAIHALYWAAIVHLEQRRAWRHNPARTPREYLRLLKAGSAEQRELRGLTRALERTWYGQREARADEYDDARQSFQRLAGEMAQTRAMGETAGGQA